MLLDFIGPDAVLKQPLGNWVATQGHQLHHWYMDFDAHVIYYQYQQMWRAHPATRSISLWFDTCGKAFEAPRNVTHVVDVNTRASYLEASALHRCNVQEYSHPEHGPTFTSRSGLVSKALPYHIHTLLGTYQPSRNLQYGTALSQKTLFSLLTDLCYLAWETTAGL
jgi:hypothetical protein